MLPCRLPPTGGVARKLPTTTAGPAAVPPNDPSWPETPNAQYEVIALAAQVLTVRCSNCPDPRAPLESNAIRRPCNPAVSTANAYVMGVPTLATLSVKTPRLSL